MSESAADDSFTPRLHHRVGFGFAATIVLVLLVLLPFAVGSALSEILEPPRFSSFSITPPEDRRPPHTRDCSSRLRASINGPAQ